MVMAENQAHGTFIIVNQTPITATDIELQELVLTQILAKPWLNGLKAADRNGNTDKSSIKSLIAQLKCLIHLGAGNNTTSCTYKEK